MDGPLWTDAHAPDRSELPQPEVREHLSRAVSEPMNLVVFGPRGVGKTAAVRALARETHADPDNDFVVLTSRTSSTGRKRRSETTSDSAGSCRVDRTSRSAT
jgi:Cdc6-like AAA superfamily ATPase